MKKKWPFVTGGLVAGLVLITMAAAIEGCDSHCEERDMALAGGGVMITAGVVLLILGAVIDPRLDVSLPEEYQGRFQLGGGSLFASLGGGRWVTANPGGLQGVF